MPSQSGRLPEEIPLSTPYNRRSELPEELNWSKLGSVFSPSSSFIMDLSVHLSKRQTSSRISIDAFTDHTVGRDQSSYNTPFLNPKASALLVP